MSPVLVDLAARLAERIIDHLVDGKPLDSLTLESILTVDEQNALVREAALRAARARRKGK